jgi:endoglucanase
MHKIQLIWHFILLAAMNIILNSYSHIHLLRSRPDPDTTRSKQNTFWISPKKGANFFNENESFERLESAARLGLHWVRLTPSKWKSAFYGSRAGHFLIGSRVNYVGLVKEDVAHLRKMLDAAQAANIKVVLTFLDIPGHYWSQHNDGKQDRRLWQDKTYWPLAIQFLVDVVQKFKGHPALVGYDLLNEPSPEKTGIEFNDWLTGSYSEWVQKISNGPQDLNAFYARAVSEIRKVDSLIPIIIEPGYYATPWAISVLQPIDDENVIYSIHMYEPFLYTFNHRHNQATFSYPGTIPYGELTEQRKEQHWDQAALRAFFKPVQEWQKKFAIPNSRIMIGEFGVNRFAAGAPQYFSDLIEIFDEYKWHWAFYSFREDSWQIMDYELGQKKPNWQYWQAI